MDGVAVLVFLMFMLIALGAWIIPKPPPPKRPDHIHEVYDLNKKP